ncbi:MAG: LysR family transcriptional regulator [Acidimicrobiia bacterium]|nr:LysR family transcriptional regulator [Acidimicrobiia bacterium]
MYDIRLRTLSYLVAVSRTGHFGDAAVDLGVSQPALSQALARLEGEVGVALFVKAGRARLLTPAGEHVVRFAESVLAQASRLESDLRARADGLAGTLRVGMIDAAALYLVAASVQRFRDERPDVELVVTVDASDALLAALADNRLDVALVVGPVADERATSIVTEPLGIYGPPIDNISEAQPWVLYPAGSHTRALVDEGLALRSIRPEVHAESDNPSVLAQLVRLGAGWTVLPAGIAEAGPEPLVRVGKPIAQREIVGVTSAEAADDALTQAFLAGM